MTAKQLVFRDDAYRRILRGVDVLANAVRETLGPCARTVLLEQPSGPPVVINSGVVVARAITLPDPFENIGVDLVREAAARTSEVAGDGTTTATLLAAAIVREGVKYVAAGGNPMDLKRGIDRAVAALVPMLHAIARPCTARREIAQVAGISANNDEGIGTLIADAMARVGNEGAITVEEGSGLESTLTVVEGMQFDRGYLSPYFINVEGGTRVVLEDAAVLVCARKLSVVTELLPALEVAAGKGWPLLLIAEDIEGDALALLVINTLRGTLKACAVKAPAFGERQRAMLEDIAVLTAATLVDAQSGIGLAGLTAGQFGHVRRVEVDKDACTLIGGCGTRERIDARIGQLRAERERAGADDAREGLDQRLACLAGGVAMIKVGGASEAEMKERRARVEDALHATRAAVAEGILPGGGVALLRAGAVLETLHGAGHDEDCGVRIVQRAIEEPLRQLVANAGLDAAVVIERVLAGDGAFGFNAASGEYGDLVAMGVLDPCKVTRCALQNAASVAGLILTIGCMVAPAPAGGG
ncbi:chaperonin GroEL [Thauera chlorobenzoica]|uniref:60 kDa chaperonin n=1 Tax=Thauera chlorobenzoica TaxID=96773 RepID=A0A1H5VQ71_9RHOO|nr:chaperonin GroEL [Thauera chlorobenzoica]APR03867.1 chaperone GroEL [Thauera chlorobenzoica]SEF89449.1 chaperonin GroEL [Thauera chlorobenzoica]